MNYFIIEAYMVTYTTLIDDNESTGKLEKCWEIYEEIKYLRPGETDADEMLLSYMVRLAAATHEAEKALKIFAELEENGFTEVAKPYNSIISALGSTYRYAEEAIRYW